MIRRSLQVAVIGVFPHVTVQSMTVQRTLQCKTKRDKLLRLLLHQTLKFFILK